MKQSSLPPFALIGFILGILIAFSAMLAGFGSRWGWWNFRIGFIILRWAAYGGILAAVISLIGAILTWPGVLHRNFLLSIFGLIIAILVFGVPLFYWRTAQRVPPIHDITTDWKNPPRFVSILPLRENAPNPAEYGGPKITEKQLEAYPDLAPAIFSFPVDEAFQRALATTQKMGWKIVETNLAEGRIEATDTTFWFGFKDDIVIRVAPADHGSRVDIRSVSRVGRSDIGTNAKRIRKYLNELKEAG